MSTQTPPYRLSKLRCRQHGRRSCRVRPRPRTDCCKRMARPPGSARRPRQRLWPLMPHGCLGGRLEMRCVAPWTPGTASTTIRGPGVGAALGYSRAMKRVEAPAARAAPEPVADKVGRTSAEVCLCATCSVRNLNLLLPDPVYYALQWCAEACTMVIIVCAAPCRQRDKGVETNASG